MDQARRAQAKLANRLLRYPQVQLIDIGYPPGIRAEEAGDELVLRVHLQRLGDKNALPIPAEVDGIPVYVIAADYRLEED